MLVFLFVLCFGRSLLDSIKCVQEVFVETFDENCIFLLPCTYGARICTHNSCRTILLVLGLVQPLLLISVPWFIGQSHENSTAGHIFFVSVSFNETAIFEKHVDVDKNESIVFAADIVLLALPYTIISALGLSVMLHTTYAPYSEPLWDAELFEHAVFCAYDLLFAAQLYCMLVALLSIGALISQLELILSLALGLCACMLYFMAISRAQPSTGPEQIVNIIAFALTAAILCGLWTQFFSLSHLVSLVAGSCLTFMVLALNLFHSLCHGEARALTVILFRTAVSVVITILVCALAAYQE